MCGDPGGANAVAPVVEALRQDQRLDVHAFAYAEARSLWAKRLLPFDALDEHLTPDDAFGLLQRHKARLVLVGTSVNRLELERKFVAAARRNSTASLAVLDFWSNYRQRFSDESGRLAYLPDRIAVMDQRAHNEMVMCGFDPDRLVITGQPALDNLALSRAQFTPVSHEQIRRSLGISPLERLVVFASQPLSAMYGSDPAIPGHLGYTEHSVLIALSKAIGSIAQRARDPIVLVIRPHPREHSASFEAITCHPARVIVSSEGDPRALVMAADAVIGMNTMLLVESCLLGCLTISLQPGLRLPDALPTNRSGQSIAVYEEREIEPVLERALTQPFTVLSSHSGSASAQLAGNATQRVVDLACQMLRLDAHG